MRDPKLGIGGAPTRCTTLPTDPKERKQYPIASGVLEYFPDALAAVAHVSWKGNEQHNPGQPLHWARSKSMDEPDTLIRHFMERGSLDSDGIRHSAKLAWRALALLQKEIEQERGLLNADKRYVEPGDVVTLGPYGGRHLIDTGVGEDRAYTEAQRRNAQIAKSANERVLTAVEERRRNLNEAKGGMKL